MSSVVSTFFLAKCEAGLTSPKMRPWAAKYLPLVVDPFKAITCMYGELHLPTLAFAISNSPYMQTEQAFQAWIDGYKPSAEQICYIMADARPARTPKMLQAFLAAKPTADLIYKAMRDCGDFARTPEMVKLFLAAKPSAAELAWSLKDCGQVAQTPEVIAAFLAAKPTADLIYEAMRYGGEFARTPKMLQAFLAAKPSSTDLTYAMCYCGEFARTTEVMSAFLAAGPIGSQLIEIISGCGEFAQTPEMLAAFITGEYTVYKLPPNAYALLNLMKACEYARTPEMLRAFINAKPDAEDIRRLIEACGDFAQTPELLALATA